MLELCYGSLLACGAHCFVCLMGRISVLLSMFITLELFTAFWSHMIVLLDVLCEAERGPGSTAIQSFLEIASRFQGFAGWAGIVSSWLFFAMFSGAPFYVEVHLPLCMYMGGTTFVSVNGICLVVESAVW